MQTPIVIRRSLGVSLRKTVFVTLLFLIAGGLSVPAAAQSTRPGLDRVAEWNQLAMAAVRANRASDADAARLYAMLNVAVYDAVNGVEDAHRRRTPALVAASGPRQANADAAAVSAAHTVLVALDPDRSAAYDVQLAAHLAAMRADGRRTAGVAWGRSVGEQVVAARADDGSTPVQSQPGGTGPGVFPAAWSGVQYRDLRPFVLTDPAARVLGPPPALTSLDYAAAFADVALVGNANIPAPDKLATFQFWSVPTGTDQPPGEWLKIALTVAAARGVGLSEGVRLLALVTMAMSDDTIVAVGTKYAHRHWRPTTAIQQADTDDNSYTVTDPAWRARAGSAGSTPEWISGHSSYSATAAGVLAGFFCADNIAFDVLTDTAPGGVARSYPGFSAAAAEAGRSRVYGGQHFEFSNQAGLAQGRGVASEVLRVALLRTKGPQHMGECPL